MNFPQSLKYTSSHEWVNVTGTTGVVGITEFAQKELGDIVFVELPETGRKVKAGEPCSVVESVKTASDIYSPLSGKIVKTNEELARHPELINEDCYGKGWIFELELSDKSELGKLLDAATYQKDCTH